VRNLPEGRSALQWTRLQLDRLGIAEQVKDLISLGIQDFPLTAQRSSENVS
jgi:hypothetical protein